MRKLFLLLLVFSIIVSCTKGHDAIEEIVQLDEIEARGDVDTRVDCYMSLANFTGRYVSMHYNIYEVQFGGAGWFAYEPETLAKESNLSDTFTPDTTEEQLKEFQVYNRMGYDLATRVPEFVRIPFINVKDFFNDDVYFEVFIIVTDVNGRTLGTSHYVSDGEIVNLDIDTKVSAPSSRYYHVDIYILTHVINKIIINCLKIENYEKDFLPGSSSCTYCIV
ncbi:MAG: hypothetical protein LUF90_00570 [Rikenellaceae bacterium]|nr:hypothetical protein [Rikenellaceae bacterium]